MAITPTYEHTQVMSRLNVNGAIYWMKDADLRAFVATFGDAVFKNVAEEIAKGNVNLATSGDVALAIENAVKDLEGVMHFRGVVERNEGETDLEALARVITSPKAGDVAIMKDNGKEYIYGTAWEEVGDQNIYLTKADANANFVKNTVTVAGKALDHNITVAELEGADALDLKALSHKDSATGTISTADSIDDITVAKADTYTVAGTAVAVPATYNELDVTPAGSVDISAKAAAAASYEKATSATISTATSDTGNYLPQGSISLPTYTSSVTPSKEEVATVTNAGTAYTLSNGSVVKGDDTTAKFVKKGVSVAMDTTDTEQLNISYVDNTDATFYADAVTAAGGVTYTNPTLSGSLPTFGTKEVMVGASVDTVANGPASFSGTRVQIGAELGYETANANVTQPTFTAAFSGTTKKVTPSAATTVDAAPSNATITVGTETKKLTLNKSDKTVTVS